MFALLIATGVPGGAVAQPPLPTLDADPKPQPPAVFGVWIGQLDKDSYQVVEIGEGVIVQNPPGNFFRGWNWSGQVTIRTYAGSAPAKVPDDAKPKNEWKLDFMCYNPSSTTAGHTVLVVSDPKKRFSQTWSLLFSNAEMTKLNLGDSKMPKAEFISYKRQAPEVLKQEDVPR